MEIQPLLVVACLALLPAATPLGAQEIPPQGPQDQLRPEFAACREGLQQSPVDLDTRAPLPGALPPLAVRYQPFPLEIATDGHAVRIEVPPGQGGTLTVGDMDYALVQIVFHTPSEHTFNGSHSDLEAQLVHQAADGRMGVVAVLLNKGAANAGLRTITPLLPARAGEPAKAAQTAFNPAELLPADPSYIGYPGSMTTPPCAEGVNWMVMTHVTGLSARQLAKFTALFPNNNRPVQPLTDRPLQLSR